MYPSPLGGVGKVFPNDMKLNSLISTFNTIF